MIEDIDNKCYNNLMIERLKWVVYKKESPKRYERKKLLFNELKEIEKYDGIWACSPILHLPKNELKVVFGKMIKALKREGIIYISFKYGDFEGERNGRYFTDFTEEKFNKFVKILLFLFWWIITREDIERRRINC